MPGSTSERAVDAVHPESALELVRRVQARGGELRVRGSVLQCRPVGVLTKAELDWLREHRGEVVRALRSPDPDNTAAFRRWLRARFGADYVYLGDAGPGVPVWTPMPRGLSARAARSRGAPIDTRPRTGASRRPTARPQVSEG